MNYHQHIATGKLAQFVKWFWSIESDDPTQKTQKIIPDGYPELIFHYGDPFEINLTGRWEIQGMNLLAGQIRQHFELRNTGNSGIFAIKLQPWVIREFFDVEMHQLTNRVIELSDQMMEPLTEVHNTAVSEMSFDRKVENITDLFTGFISNWTMSKGAEAVESIMNANGMISVKEIISETGLSERALERYFKSHIGVSPKFYSRIIRLSYIFRLAQEEHKNWAELAYRAGYYDQTHFIKNFKEFTGEDPSKYGFNEKNMANFFLK